MTEEYKGLNNQRCFVIEAGSAKQAWVKASRASAAIGIADCGWCRHHYCGVCEEFSAGKQYSDYWICHSCGELNLRIRSSNL